MPKYVPPMQNAEAFKDTTPENAVKKVFLLLLGNELMTKDRKKKG